MIPIDLIHKYYPFDNDLRRILIDHSQSVAEKALTIARNHPQLKLDEQFLYEASMVHDIGIYLTSAPGIHCYGSFPYIAHGYLGASLLLEEGHPRHALVCERHTGAGISMEEIAQRGLPIPYREMIPVSLEEQVICFADKFFSKSHLGKEKSIDKALKGISKYGEEGVIRFKRWCDLFL